MTDTQLTGFNMGANVIVRGKLQPDGITYFGMNIVELFLGDGADDLTVVNLTQVNHFIDLGGGDDIARVKSVDGPLLLHGGGGSDTVFVGSDDSKLDIVNAVFGYDGGDNDSDRLVLDNAQDQGLDEVLNVTRTMVELKTMDLSEDRGMFLPEDSYIIKLRGASGGSFTLELDDPISGSLRNITVPYDVSTARLESAIQRGLIPDDESCGIIGTSRCARAVKVWSLGEAFVIFFIGERLNAKVRLGLFTDSLEGFENEMFQNKTNDILSRNSDVVYANLEFLDVFMGDHDIVTNVRGTTADTTIVTQSGDDTFFVSSEANQNTANAGTVDFLHGWLDYLEDDLHLVSSTGRHRLMISDEKSKVPKGVGIDGNLEFGPATLTKDSLRNLHPALGDIYFTANGGHWSDGVNLWFGGGGDRLNVESVPSNPNASPLRTATSVHCGDGDDIMNVNLVADQHDGVVFIANGQHGNDAINASKSSLGVILFGDDGDDSLVGGSGNDVLIGDYGRVVWRSSDNIFNPDGVIESIAGQGGFGDYTDGVIREITDVYSVSTALGGNDHLTMGAGDDVGIGGAFDDSVRGDAGSDIIVSMGVYSNYSGSNNDSSFFPLCSLAILLRFHISSGRRPQKRQPA